jgi:pyruvate kinase
MDDSWHWQYCAHVFVMSAAQKRVAIISTITPASSSVASIKKMLQSGVHGVRIPFTHENSEHVLEMIEHVNIASEETGTTVALIQDIQGPELRIGTLPEAGLMLKEGALVQLQAGVQFADTGTIPVPYDRFAFDLGRGDAILLAGGTRQLEVRDVQGSIVVTKVVRGGMLLSHANIHIPTTTLSAEEATEHDDEALALGLKYSMDFVCCSFVRTAEDVRIVREKILKYLPEHTEPPQVLVKIHKYETTKAFDELLHAADGVLITHAPEQEKELIAKCIVAGKLVITSVDAVTDVAHVVSHHTDAVLVSVDGTSHMYADQQVREVSAAITATSEDPLDVLFPSEYAKENNIPAAVAASAVLLARHTNAAAILVTTSSGYSARQISRYHPHVPLFAATPSSRTMRQLLLSWGVVPFIVREYSSPETMMQSAVDHLKEIYNLPQGSKIVIMSGLSQDSSARFDCSIRVREL